MIDAPRFRQTFTHICRGDTFEEVIKDIGKVTKFIRKTTPYDFEPESVAIYSFWSDDTECTHWEACLVYEDVPPMGTLI